MPRRFQTLTLVSNLADSNDEFVIAGQGSNADERATATTLKVVTKHTVTQTAHGYTSPLTLGLPIPVFFDDAQSDPDKIKVTKTTTQGEAAQPFNAFIIAVPGADTLTVIYATKGSGLVLTTSAHSLLKGQFFWLDAAGTHSSTLSDVRLWQVTGSSEVTLSPHWGAGTAAGSATNRKMSIDLIGVIAADPSLDFDAGAADNKKIGIAASATVAVDDIAVTRPGWYTLNLYSSDATSVEFTFNNITGRTSHQTASTTGDVLNVFYNGTNLIYSPTH